ncbi:social motility TPR repeat lipoprotein Tgl [Haloferula helveola]|uniref:Social motility TPR repeat lipoprotein Tgl n=1 Tax=Haloferula helveola TaxID=490095 RepID=A0ABM7RB33_9BACT|nr:social motility TPR repeat lipoprotein Tgl [Haloferula helveola]
MAKLNVWWMTLLPALLALAVYAPVAGYPFVNYDDPFYFYSNPHVVGGPTAENLRWAFEIHGPSMWIPLTWMSHQVMAGLFGTDPGPQHVFNLILHAANAMLLGVWLRRSTGRAGLALGIAAVFAVHPIHVESVAWVTERKDVLALFFCLLALLFHERRCRSGGWGSYVGMFVCHALAVMAKPLAVTLPCAMLLWECWPLVGRLRVRAVLEKVPLLAVSAVGSWLTILCQQSAGAIGSAADFPFILRLQNAAVAYATYLKRLVLPDDLSVFYPYPETLPLAVWLPSLIVLLVISAAAWKLRRTLPALAVGWLWFLGTLLPMIGLVQAGAAAMADRYAYFSFIGLYVAVAWSLDAWLKRQPELKPAVAGAVGAMVIGLAVAGRWQVSFWQDSTALMRRAIEVTEGNYLAHNNLGLALEERGDTAAARAAYGESLAVRPDHTQALSNLGALEAKQGNLMAALDLLEAAVAADVDHAAAWHNLGKARLQGGDIDGSREAFRKAIDIAPDFGMPRYDLAVLEMGRRHWDEAVTLLADLVALAPDHADAWVNLGFVELKRGNLEAAERAFVRAVGLGSELGRLNLERLRAERGSSPAEE